MAKRFFSFVFKMVLAFAISISFAQFFCSTFNVWGTTIVFGTLFLANLFGAFD